MSKTMAEVLAEHEMNNSPVIRGEGYTRCSCGFLSKGAYSRASHNRHVSDALSAAGFGLVADAKAEAWDHGHHDGAVDQMLHMENGGAKTTPNPYRAAS